MEATACYCDLEPCDVYNERRRKANKEHRCAECHKTIRKGQTYIVLNSLFEGVWSTVKRCIQCQQIGRDYCCGAAAAGEVWSMVWESLGLDLRTNETIDDDEG